MAALSLSCLSKFEPGAIGSDSGHVTIPTAEVPFPVTLTGQASMYGSCWGYAVKQIGDTDDLFVILY